MQKAAPHEPAEQEKPLDWLSVLVVQVFAQAPAW
jgi:hypothetical protein